VVVVTVDALRADALGPRYQKRLPNFVEMMKRGVTFTQARSAGSGTRVSLAGLLAGRYHSQLRWNHSESLRSTLERDRLPRLPDLLEPHGVHTVSAVTLANSLEPKIGIVTGFEELKQIPDNGELKGTPEIVEHLLDTLKRQGPSSLFYYPHLLDPHFPYYRHREGPKGSEEAYHQEVEYVDGFVGKIRKGIEEYGLASRTLFIVSADHGEGFGEHGLRGHNKLHYDVMVHVPLIVEGPGLEPRTVTTPVSMMDIGPTVLDVLGAPTPGYFMGESLVPMLRGGAGPKHRPTFAGASFGEAVVFQDGMKVILRTRPPTEEVYDLRKDPKEESNLRDTPEGEKRTALARAYSAAHRWPNGERPKTTR
jgi:arylsulfatase A-like enzyme